MCRIAVLDADDTNVTGDATAAATLDRIEAVPCSSEQVGGMSWFPRD